jgi:hypothetical protein
VKDKKGTETQTEIGVHVLFPFFDVPLFYPTHVLTPFWSAKHSTRTVAVLTAQARTVRGQGPDDPRPGVRLGFLPDGRTVRDLGPNGPRVRRGGGRSPTTAWISLPGGTPLGTRDPR